MLSAPRGPKTCYKVRFLSLLTCQRLFYYMTDLETCSALQCHQEGHVSTVSLPSDFRCFSADTFPVPFTQIARDCPTNVAPVETAALA